MILIGVAAACIILFVALKWWSEGLINGSELILLVAVFGGMSVGVFAVETLWARILVISMLAGSGGWMVYRHIQYGSKRYFKDRIKEFEEAIRLDPRNLAARSGLADAYYQLGDLDSAIAAIEVAVQSSHSSVQESYKLKLWTRERELRDSKPIMCKSCYGKNIWGETICRVCGQPLVYPQENLLVRMGPARIAICCVWLVMVILAFAMLPHMQAAMLALCISCAGIGWMLLASRKV